MKVIEAQKSAGEIIKIILPKGTGLLKHIDDYEVRALLFEVAMIDEEFAKKKKG